MIRVHYLPNPWEPNRVELFEIDHIDGMVVDNCVPKAIRQREHLSLQVNGERASLQQSVADEASVLVVAMPADPITVTYSLFGAKLATFTGLAAYASLGVYAAGLVLIGRLIAKAHAPGKRRDDNESPAYGYSGQANIRVEGGPIEMIFGRVRYAGTVIQESVRNYQYPPSADYTALISYGHGPIKSIGGIDTDTAIDQPLRSGDAGFPSEVQINGNPATTFNEVEISVRLGGSEQEIVPGFDVVKQVVAIDQLLDAPTTTSASLSLIISQSNFTTSTADDHFTGYGIEHPFVDDYDSFVVTVSFDAGLYQITTSGGVNSALVGFAMRYIELDGGGSPITSGGPEGDGYVRLPPTSLVGSTQQSPFSIDFEFPFYDPQTYSHPTQGRALLLDRASPADYANNTSPSTPPAWVAGNAFDSWSVTFWINSDVIDYDVTKGSILKFRDGSNRGFEIRITRASSSYGDFTIPEVIIGDGSGLRFENPHTDNNFALDMDADVWHFVAITYKNSYVGGSSDRLRIYVDGVMYFHQTLNFGCKVPAAGTDFEVGRSFDGEIDELELINTELTTSDVLTRYLSGAGRYIDVDPAHVGLWHFDLTASPGVDASSYANTLTMQNGAAVPGGSANGKINAPTAMNVRKRGRYQVEVVRANRNSTNSNFSDDATLRSVTGVLDETLSYPYRPLLGTRIKATNQLNSAYPTITSLIEGILVPVWDGMSTQFPSAPLRWSRNPAWIALYLIISRNAMGRLYSIDDVDLTSFRDFADYCDEKVYDKQGKFTATGDWTDMLYVGGSGVGSVTVYFTSAAYESVQWEVGDFIGIVLLPVLTSGDLNTADGEGWEITALDDVNKTVTFAVELVTDPWTSGTLLSASTTVSGQLEGREYRHTFDGAFDTLDRGAWDALLTVLLVGRGAPIREGKRIRLKWEAPQSPVDIIGHGSFERDSFEYQYAGVDDKPNSYVAEFLDEDRNHTRVPTTLNDPSLENQASLEKMRRESVFLEGFTRRSAVKRHLAWLLNVNRTILRFGSFNTKIESLPWDVGDVLICSAEMMGRGVSGRIYAQVDQSTVQLDQPVTLAPATTYVIYVRNAQTGKYIRREISAAAGTYAIGDDITLNASMNFAPAVDDAYILVEENEEFLIRVTGTTLNVDMTKRIEWVEYSDVVYDDEWFEDLDSSEGGPGFAPLNAGTMPPTIDHLVVEEMAVRMAGDSSITRVRVSWSYDDADVTTLIKGASVMASIGGAPFEEIIAVTGGATTAEAILARAKPGDDVTIAVVPMSYGGARRNASGSLQRRIRIRGIGVAPSAPTDLDGRMDGDLCAYSFMPADFAMRHELRRGGWILGDRIVTLSPAAIGTPALSSWASAFNTNVSRVLCRALSSAGFYSEAATLEKTLTPAGARTVPAWITAANVAWQSYADGWRTASSPPAGDPVLTGFEVVDDAAHGDWLRFDSSALEATYETAYTAPGAHAAIRAYVEAWWDAVQEHPLTGEQETWAAGDPRYSRWTAEGPMTVLVGETANCTLRAEVLIDDGGGFASEWQPVRCGAIYSLSDIKFRLVATRPSTSYNVRIRKFFTRVRQQAFAAVDTY